MSNELRVGDEYRTNRLSTTPGGKTVSVTYDTGKTLIYDKVKRPGSYVKSIHSDSSKGAIQKIEVDGLVVWERGVSKKNYWEI